MQDTNAVVLVGRLVREAELKYLNSGSAVTNFSIAVNTAKKTENGWEDEGNFFDVSLFGKLGEALKPYLLKGSQVCVMGRLRQQRWTDKDGANKSKVVIMAENVQLVGGKRESSENTGEIVENAIKKTNEKKADYRPVPPGMPTLSAITESESFSEDIPF